MTDAFAAKATYGQVLAVPRFRVLFLGRVLGISADTLRSVALAVVVFRRTDSPLLAAVAFTVGFLPQVVGGLFLGAMADRFPPRALITAGYALQCVVGLVLAFGSPSVAGSLVLVGVVACLAPVTSGAFGRVLAEILTGDAYVLGRSLSYLVAVAAQLIGLAAGGALIAWLGVERTMLVTAGMHLLASVISRLLLPRTETARSGGSIVRKSWQGNAALVAAPGVVPLILAQCLPAAYMAGAESLLIPYSVQRAFSPGETGLLLASLPVGMLVGDIVVGRAFAPATRERLVLPLLLVLGAPPVALALVLPYAGVVAVFAVAGFGSAYLLGLQRRFLEAVPSDLQGQGFALLSTATMTVQGIGPLVFGAAAEFVHVGPAMALTGVSSLVTTVLLRRVHRG
ncbi:MFS transporter [Actinokineospora cianjurensis]|uniref:Putative MFS family arabinose efflux permease n=1 Tax=Actinokineospora cianjurensis TaxID=585224 RepID=A0A421BBX6_9PSEU|nr:MFS transporter [Actinokineospora cianjurensis]RLK61841.1 putative MFS family arabinose efflux permease [Actinokineospora cianjurensis]